MIRHTLLAFSLTLAIPGICPVSADEIDSLELKYTIMSEGEHIGILTHNLFLEENGHSFAEYSHIKVSGWWGKIDITGNLIEEFHGINALVSSDSKTLDGNTAYWSKIERNKEGFWGSFAKIKKTTDIENKALADLGLAITEAPEQGFGEIRSISASIFVNKVVHSEGEQFTREDFDTTDTNLAFFIQSFGGKPLPRKLRLLDTDNLKITESEMTDLGYEEISIGDKKIRSRHLKLSNPKYKPSHIWIKDAATNLPFMVRFVGEDEDGPFEIVFTP